MLALKCSILPLVMHQLIGKTSEIDLSATFYNVGNRLIISRFIGK